MDKNTDLKEGGGVAWVTQLPHLETEDETQHDGSGWVSARKENFNITF